MFDSKRISELEDKTFFLQKDLERSLEFVSLNLVDVVCGLIEQNNELKTTIRALQQDLNYAGSQISDLIKLYAQLDAKFEAHKSVHDRELGWTGY